MEPVSDDATYCGQQLLGRDTVLIRYSDIQAGAGLTPAGLWVEHSKRLPAVFGEVKAVGPGAIAAGLAKGMVVSFTRYAGEVTDILDDGSTFAVFDYRDIGGKYVNRRS